MSAKAGSPVDRDFASATAHLRERRFAEAEAGYRKVLAANGRHHGALHNLGIIALRTDRPAEAIRLFKRALVVKPDHADTYYGLGSVLQMQGRRDDAVTSFREALRIKPDYADVHNDLGNALREQGRLDDAVACYRQALRVNLEHADVHNNLGNTLKELGRLDDASACYREALRIRPDYALAHSNLLMSQQYRVGVTLKRMNELHAEWDERHGIPLRAEWRDHDNKPDPGKQLRIGFVSPDLGLHPVGFFLVKLLENRPEKAFVFICYSDRKPDSRTKRLKTVANEWTDTRGISDQGLSNHIRSDGIDILFDLAGHTGRNRLLVFARKPAPIQISWMGYVGTTGLAAMDYLMADNRHVPTGADQFYSEKIIRMPDGYVCYDPPAYAPWVGPPPFERNGFVTFGSFSNPAKINDHVMAAWAEILKSVPGSRLVLKYQNIITSESNRRRFDERFSAHGVDTTRLILEGRSVHRELLARYNEIDIALDTFPYSGGLTTCEALWMGVPVVTVLGETFASRHSLSHLSNLGLAELAARDVSHFIELAVELANDSSRLAALRAGLRNRMAKSALCDGPKFARHFASAMREVWRKWCSGRAN